MDLKKLLDKKSLMIVCGLGGVGKTTLAAALGFQAAKLGKKVAVITVDPSKRLADVLGLNHASGEPQLVWKGKGPGELHACLLNAKETFDHLIKKHAPEGASSTILENELYQQLSLMLAGTQEYMAMEKLYDLSSPDSKSRFDLVIVDTPPARHAIDFLKAPMRLIKLLNESALRWLIAPSMKLGFFGSRILKGLGALTGNGILEDLSQLMQISLTLLDGFTERADIIQKRLTGKESAFFLVASARQATFSDALEFREEINRLGFFLEGILVNRVSPLFKRDAEIKSGIAYAKKQSEAWWKEVALWLGGEEAISKHLQKKLKPLLRDIPYSSFIPESEAVDASEGLLFLQKLGELLHC